MSKVLITGGAGFVGRHFTRHFLDRGDQVHVVDSIEAGTGGIAPNSPWPLFDPRDYAGFSFERSDCRDYFKANPHAEYDLVLHLAAMVGGRLMIEYNPLAVADDLSIDAAFWQWAKLAQPRKTICFSSSAAYPVRLQAQNNYVLLEEGMIDFAADIGMPDMSYGWAKLTCEYLARLAFERHGIKSVSYRPFSGYGPDQDDTYPFPSICKRAISGSDAEPFVVWGTGEQMRDFIHIDDCVAGVISTMGAIDNGEAINLSTGIFTSFLDFAHLATQACGYTTEITGMSDRPSGVFARGGDTAKQRSLGFTHSISFESGIKSAIEYYSANP